MDVSETRAELEKGLRWIAAQQWPDDVMVYIDARVRSTKHEARIGGPPVVSVSLHCRSMESVRVVRRWLGTVRKGASGGTVWLDGKVQDMEVALFLPSDVCHIRKAGEEKSPVYEYDCPSSVLRG